MSNKGRGSKENRTGRSQAPGEHFTKMIRSTLELPAWRALPPVAQALYPFLKLEWRGPNANNNGAIRFSVRQAAVALGVSNDTAARGFHALQAKGFLVMKEKGVLGLDGAAKAPAFEVTEIAMPNTQDGRRLFKDWRPNGDFPVQKASANNPTGRNGKTKPCPEILDETVLKIRTFRK